MAHKNLSTEARLRCGPGRSSDETAVMVVERRTSGYPLLKLVNQ